MTLYPACPAPEVPSARAKDKIAVVSDVAYAHMRKNPPVTRLQIVVISFRTCVVVIIFRNLEANAGLSKE